MFCFNSSLISTPWETASREAVEESKEKERESSNHKACVKHIRAHFNLPLCSVFCCCKFAFVIRPLLGLTSWILLYNFEGVTMGVSWLSYERRPAYTHWLSHAFRGCLRNCLQLRSKPIIHSNIAKCTRELLVECVGKENRRDKGWASIQCLSTSFWQRSQVAKVSIILSTALKFVATVTTGSRVKIFPTV